MDSRKIASILIKNNWSCIIGDNSIYPLWKPQSHLNYLASSDYTDIIIATDDSSSVLPLNLKSGKNYIFSAGWSNVVYIPAAFQHGFSKIFLGGKDRLLPSAQEHIYFSKMLDIYGSSSFGLNIHIDDCLPDLDPFFLSQFNEITLIPRTLQLFHDDEALLSLASTISDNICSYSHEINVTLTHNSYSKLSRIVTSSLNYINYAEHGVSTLR